MLQIAARLAVEVHDVETIVDEDGSWSIARKQQALGFLQRSLALDQCRVSSRDSLSYARPRRYFNRRKLRHNPPAHRLLSVDLMMPVDQSEKFR